MKNSIEKDLESNVEDVIVTACAIQATDIPDVGLTPAEDGTFGKDVLDQVYTIFMNQSGEQKSRPADEGNKPQDGSIGKITYELDGGSITGAKKSYTTADYGYIPPAPTKKGYKFTGWEPENIPTDSTGNVTFTAKWKETTTTLMEGGTWGLGYRLEDLAGSAKNLKAFQKNSEEPSEEIKASARNIAASGEPVYAWFESDTGTIKYWSDSEVIYLPEDCERLFSGKYFSNLTDISGFSYFDTSKVKNMSSMFLYCGVTDVTPLANWDMSNVTSTERMFEQCPNLSDITPLANWNTSNVQNFSHMFLACKSLRNRLNTISKWDISSATSIEGLFEGDTDLTDLTPLANWDVSKIENFARLFEDCSNLTDLTPIADWNTSKNINFAYLFSGCEGITDLTPLANWNISSLTTIQGIFSGCTGITDLSPISNWDTTNVNNMQETFNGCTGITDLSPISNWDTSNLRNLEETFNGCAGITDLSPISNWHISKVRSMEKTFMDCNGLTNLKALSGWNVSNVTAMREIFSGCSNLADPSAINNWDINSDIFRGYNSYRMFFGCPSHPTFTKYASNRWDEFGTFYEQGE